MKVGTIKFVRLYKNDELYVRLYKDHGLTVRSIRAVELVISGSVSNDNHLSYVRRIKGL